MSVSKCNRCGAPIIWLTLVNGEKTPVDEIKLDFIGRNHEGKLTNLQGRLPHWDTCANPPAEEEE